jgi:hypothetical protein
MKLTIVQCNCGNPEPHRKFRAEDGRETKGFFSLIEGIRIQAKLLTSGQIVQTDEEKAATLQELESCGLPEEYSPAPEPGPGSPPPSRRPLPQALLQIAALTLSAHPQAKRRGMVEVAVARNIFTAEEGEKILALAAEA